EGIDERPGAAAVAGDRVIEVVADVELAVGVELQTKRAVEVGGHKVVEEGPGGGVVALDGVSTPVGHVQVAVWAPVKVLRETGAGDELVHECPGRSVVSEDAARTDTADVEVAAPEREEARGVQAVAGVDEDVEERPVRPVAQHLVGAIAA